MRFCPLHEILYTDHDCSTNLEDSVSRGTRTTVLCCLVDNLGNEISARITIELELRMKRVFLFNDESGGRGEE